MPMKYSVQKIIDYCYTNNLVSEGQIPWLRYSIEKRFATIIGFIPFTILAVLLSNFWCSVWFIFGFSILRSRINGYHAKTLLGCILVSLITELFLLKVILPVLTPAIAVLINMFCFIILIRFAPYNHPNMHYSADEILSLKTSIRRGLVILALLLLTLLTMQLINSLRGLTLGIVLATYMLSRAYISEWRKHK